MKRCSSGIELVLCTVCAQHPGHGLRHAYGLNSCPWNKPRLLRLSRTISEFNTGRVGLAILGLELPVPDCSVPNSTAPQAARCCRTQMKITPDCYEVKQQAQHSHSATIGPLADPTHAPAAEAAAYPVDAVQPVCVSKPLWHATAAAAGVSPPGTAVDADSQGLKLHQQVRMSYWHATESHTVCLLAVCGGACKGSRHPA